MSWMHGLRRSILLALLILGSTGGAEATTYDLPLDGTVSIIGELPTSNDPSPYGPVEIEIQAIENFSLPAFNQLDPMNTVGVFQWSADFSVLNQAGSSIAEPDLSPFGTALSGYGQNCNITPYCPRPSGDASETILSGDLFLSDNALTLQIATDITALNVADYSLNLQVTLPDGLSITPVPDTLPLFLAGLGILAFLAWRARSTRSPVADATD